MVTRADVRSRVVDEAARLLREGGPAAVTTRGVAEAAGVQAPAIYRLFGDKDGLLDAVAEHVMAGFVAGKAADVEAARVADADPVDDLRAGWTAQIAFGVANPSLFRLLSDPDRVRTSAAAGQGRQILRDRIHRVAATGRLRVGEERATDLVQAAGLGVISTLLAMPPEARDPDLAEAMLDAVLDQVLTRGERSARGPESAVLSACVALRAVTGDLPGLSPAETRLMLEWLDRAIDAPA